MSISDAAFIKQFEALTLPPAELNHVSHLRIAWLYLDRLGLDDAIEKVTRGTKGFAEHHGDYEKYHRTVTEATIRIMDKRMAMLEDTGFDAFLQHNGDLVADLRSLLGMHYSENAIGSGDARVNFVQPDKREFE